MARLNGTDGNDNLIPSDSRSDDTIYAYAGDDTIDARNGDDLILPGLGNDYIVGGDGRDTVEISGNLGQYQIFRSQSGAVIRGPEGVDRLVDVEAVQTAANGTLELSSVPEFKAYSYLASYSDLSAAFGQDSFAAWNHFFEYGAREGRDITFDGASYLAANTDVLAAFGNNAEQGALHYVSYGRNEGRNTDFDGAQYVASHGDLIAAFRNQGDADALGTNHFLSFGFQEGRTTDIFNEDSYAALNPDLAAAGLTTADQLAEHWINYGSVEGRAGAYDALIG
jgi:serralysin